MLILRNSVTSAILGRSRDVTVAVTGVAAEVTVGNVKATLPGLKAKGYDLDAPTRSVILALNDLKYTWYRSFRRERNTGACHRLLFLGGELNWSDIQSDPRTTSAGNEVQTHDDGLGNIHIASVLAHADNLL